MSSAMSQAEPITLGLLVARTLDRDGKELGQYWKSSLVGRYGQD